MRGQEELICSEDCQPSESSPAECGEVQSWGFFMAESKRFSQSKSLYIGEVTGDQLDEWQRVLCPAPVPIYYVCSLKSLLPTALIRLLQLSSPYFLISLWLWIVSTLILSCSAPSLLEIRVGNKLRNPFCVKGSLILTSLQLPCSWNPEIKMPAKPASRQHLQTVNKPLQIELLSCKIALENSLFSWVNLYVYLSCTSK